MDIAGYDSWRLAGPYDCPEIDHEDMTDAAEKMAIDMLDDDPDYVLDLICTEEVWQEIAIGVAAGVNNVGQMRQAMVDLLITHLLENCEDDVADFINDRDPF